MRLTEEEYAQLLERRTVRPLEAPRGPHTPPLSEAVFQAAVIELAKTHGWLVYFTKDSRKSPSGYPDLTIAKVGSPLYSVELKSDTGQVTPAQDAWLKAIAGSTAISTGVWRPQDLDEIRACLTR